MSNLSRFAIGSIFSILLPERLTCFNFFKCETAPIFLTSDPSSVNFSRFSIFSKPFKLLIPWPEYMINSFTSAKSSFFIGSFTSFLFNAYLLIACCNFLSTITFCVPSFCCCSCSSSLSSISSSSTYVFKFTSKSIWKFLS